MSAAGLQSARILSLTDLAENPRVSQTCSRLSVLLGPQNTQRQAIAAEYRRSPGPDFQLVLTPRLDLPASHRHMRTVLAIMATRKSRHLSSRSSGGFHSSPSMITYPEPRKSRNEACPH